MTNIYVSHHALDRYRQRYHPTATADDIITVFCTAIRPPSWIRKMADRDDVTSLQAGELVFITKQADNGTVIITVIPTEWYRVPVRLTKTGHRGSRYYGSPRQRAKKLQRKGR